MLVHAKAPHIDVEIKGKGVEQIVELLKKTFKEIKIINLQTDSVSIQETDWFMNISKNMTPGMALKVYRDNTGSTLAELSKKTGIAVSHLSAMENDKRGIGKKTATKLGDALKCNYKRFL